MPPRMRSIRLLAALTLLFAAPAAMAYEGEGRPQEQEAPPPPPKPKLTKAPTVKKAVEAPYPPELLKSTFPRRPGR